MKARRWRHGALLGLVLVVALVAAGCGDNGDTSGGSTGTTAAAPAVDDALAAKVPDAVKSDGKILIGTDATYSPNEFLDTDGKTPIGWDIDLFAAVALLAAARRHQGDGQHQPKEPCIAQPGCPHGFLLSALPPWNRVHDIGSCVAPSPACEMMRL